LDPGSFPMKHKNSLQIALAIVALAALGGSFLYAQDKSAADKYSLTDDHAGR